MPAPLSCALSPVAVAVVPIALASVIAASASVAAAPVRASSGQVAPGQASSVQVASVRASSVEVAPGQASSVQVVSVRASSVQVASVRAGSARAASVRAGSVRAARDVVVDRTVRDTRIEESSGLAASRLHPDVLWTQNDSGNSARIYALDRRGRTEAALRIPSEPNVDWEAITSFRVPAGVAAGGLEAGTALIGIGDIGDNSARHEGVRVALVREPSKLRSETVKPVRVLRLRYPGGARDAETLLADPRDGRLYVVSKTLFGAELYGVPQRVWPDVEAGSPRVSRRTTMTRIASLDASFITDGTFLPDGRILLRGYGRMYLLDPPESARDGRIRTLDSARLPDQEQGESITLAPDGQEALIGSEGVREPILRVPLPGAARVTLPAAEPPPPAEPAPSGPAPSSGGADAATGGASGGAVADAEGAVGDGAGIGTWLAVLGGALVVTAATTGGLRLWSDRSRRRPRSGRR
jgi:hypothetical protein